MTDVPTPALVLVTGLVASGKSSVSRALAARLGAPRLEADRVRDTVLGLPERDVARALGEDTARALGGDGARALADGGAPSGEHEEREEREEREEAWGGAEARWRRDLSQELEDAVYDDLLRRAGDLLADGLSVVLDACFPLRGQRDAARALALRHGARFLFVRCEVPEDTLRARLDERGDREDDRAGWTEIAETLASRLEPAEELSAEESLTVRTDGPVEGPLEAILERLRQAPPPPPPPKTGPAPSRPGVVSFDCWGTLLAERDWPWAHALRVLALRDAAREAGHEVSQEQAQAAFDAAWQRHMALWEEHKASGAAEVARWGLEALGIADSSSLEHLIRRYEEASHTSQVVALEGAPDLLRALTHRGTPCVLVCDTGLTPGRVVRRLLAQAGFEGLLRRLAFSDEVGMPKPDPAPFLFALEGLGVDPEHVVHVGDLRRTDVAGARSLGMRTVRIRAHYDDPTGWPDADHTVDSHAELAKLLDVA